ncbi:MAG: SDR family NAD(P)-dependent oxidoreductase [Planctomycetota bacterium]|nr:SDR family NAD(P)-dependent oxidoreductase [Planctomycetota bacterium]
MITGASSGIGLATARACARVGMPVVLVARRAERLRAAADEIVRAGGRASVFEGDVADESVSRRAVDRCADEFGSVYAVFANAGYGVECPVEEMSDADVRRMFEVNFFSSLTLARAGLEHMRRAREGHILMCSSCLAKFAIPYFGVYSATKAAQNHIARAMALELEPDGISVSSVHPVGTRTEFFETTQRLSGDAPLVKHSSDFFMQTPERVAGAIVKCLQRPRPEVWTSLGVRLGMAVCVAFPSLGDWGVRRMVRERLASQRALAQKHGSLPGAAAETPVAVGAVRR